MRLIDADLAKEMLQRHANEFSDVLSRKEKTVLIGGGTSCIDKCPTVDAVPVVRCKDCKSAYINIFSAASGVAVCRRWSNAEKTIVVQHDDFCSYGERRDSDV